MKEKIKAILYADTDIDIKIDLLDALLRVACQEFKIWACERDMLILSSGGLQGFDDDSYLLPTDIWERFILDTQSKYKKDDN